MGGGPAQSLQAEKDTYSLPVGGMMIFNLIVGAGALALPKAFANAGYIAGSVMLVLLAGFSFVTVTFMIEAMAMANAVGKRDGPASQPVNEAPHSESTVLLPPEEAIKFDIRSRAEMGYMAELFFPPIGVKLFYFCVVVYLYGDLCIYAVAIPKSLQNVACGNTTAAGNTSSEHAEWSQSARAPHCFGTFTQHDTYYLFLGIVALVLGPFCFFNVQKTKPLQIATSILRWTAFLVMIFIAVAGIARDKGFGPGEPQPPPIHTVAAAHVGHLPNLFGVAIYSYMCHHSLPSLVTPIKPKSRLSALLILDFASVASFYLLLCFTATFRFAGLDDLNDLYTLNFKDFHSKFVSVFLSLFPVFTLSANFPIIAITLRNNLKTLCHRPGKPFSPFVDRFIFPAVSILPPIIVAFFTENVGVLVSFTGSYAGVGIQYVVPAMLCFYGRKHISGAFGARANSVNPHRSVFSNPWWIAVICVWSAVCIVLVTFNHIYQHYHK